MPRSYSSTSGPAARFDELQGQPELPFKASAVPDLRFDTAALVAVGPC
jgi:hypothetical protein